MSRLLTLFRKYWLFVLWVAFAPITAKAARNPGLVVHPEAVSYPWGSVLMVWVALGIESGVFFLILRSGRRLGLAFALAAILSVGFVLTWVTDLPGHHYVPDGYHFVLTGILGAMWAVKALARGGDPSEPVVRGG